jgi:hypothetical protein
MNNWVGVVVTLFETCTCNMLSLNIGQCAGHPEWSFRVFSVLWKIIWDSTSVRLWLLPPKSVAIVRSEVFTVVTMKKTVFWVMVPRSSCMNRRFEKSYHLHLQGRRICEWGTSVNKQLLEDRGDTILWNVGSHRNYTEPQPRKWLSIPLQFIIKQSSIHSVLYSLIYKMRECNSRNGRESKIFLPVH